LSWVFRCFADAGGNDVIDQEINGLPPKARSKFLERMNGFRDQPSHLWNGKRSKALTGWPGLIEIRFWSKGIVYRPIGFFGPKQNEFTLVFWATEKGDEFVPKNAPEQADGRKKLVLQNSEMSCVCDF